MRLATFPLWVTLPVSGGIAAMSTFLPDLEPWQRAIGFSAGAALFAWGMIGAFWHIYRNRRKPNPLRISLNEVARRVAYESDWGVNFEPGSYEYVARYAGNPWKLLMLEICRPLTLGDIRAWGVKIERNKDAEHGPTEIPKEYWTRGDFAPELMLTEPSISSAGGGEGAPIYRDVQLDRDGVEATWPRVAWWRRGRSRFRSLYGEWRAKWDADHRQHAAWLNRTTMPPETPEQEVTALAKPPPAASPSGGSDSLSDAEIRRIEEMLARAGKSANEAAELGARILTSPASEPPPFLRTRLESLGVPRWTSLDDAIRYIANESTWGLTHDHNDPNFSVWLAVALRDALACGDLPARGRPYNVLQGGIKSPPLRALDDIPREFWKNVHIDAWSALNDTRQSIGSAAAESAVRHTALEGMHDVRFPLTSVEELWPRPVATGETK